MKTRSRSKIPDSQLQKLAQRLLRGNEPKSDTPIIITGPPEGNRVISVGRLLERKGAWVAALVDMPLDPESEVTVFLPGNVYLAEVVSCVGKRTRFTADLQLIMIQRGSR